MKKLLLLLSLLIPALASAQQAGTIQKTPATGKVRGTFGPYGIDTLVVIQTNSLANLDMLRYNSATKKFIPRTPAQVLADIGAASSALFVPYTGATGAVNLGNYNLTIKSITVGAGNGDPTSENPATLMGYNAGLGLFTALGDNENTAIGYEALKGGTMTYVYGNTAVGSNNMRSATEAEYNTGIGADALLDLTTGDDNTAVGYSALDDLTTGSENTAIGINAGNSLITGSGNIFIGRNVDATAAMNNNVIIKSGAGVVAQHDGTNWNFLGGVTFTGGITGYVPYTGATSDLDMTGQTIYAEAIFGDWGGVDDSRPGADAFYVYNSSATGNGLRIKAGAAGTYPALTISPYNSFSATATIYGNGKFTQTDVNETAAYAGTFYNSHATGRGLEVYGGSTIASGNPAFQVKSRTASDIAKFYSDGIVYSVPLSTSNTFSATNELTVTAASAQPTLRVARTGTGARSYYWGINGGGSLFLQDETAGATRLTMTSAGLGTWAGDFVVSGASTVSGNASFAGTFNVTATSGERYISAKSGVGHTALFDAVTYGGAGTFVNTPFIFYQNSAEKGRISGAGVWELGTVTAQALTVSHPSTTTALTLNSISNSYQSTIYLNEAGVNKWEVGKNASTSNFYIYGGATAGYVMQVSHATKQTTFSNGVTFSGLITGGSSEFSGYVYSASKFLAANNVAYVGYNNGASAEIHLISANTANKVLIDNVGYGVVVGSLGTGAVQATAGALSVSSDSRLKNVKGFYNGSALAALSKIEKPKYWSYNAKSKMPEEAQAVKQFGLLADKVHSALGEEFAPTQKDKTYSLADRAILSLSVQAHQESLKRIEALEAEVKALKSK